MNASNKKRKIFLREIAAYAFAMKQSVMPYTHGYFARRDDDTRAVTYMSSHVSTNRSAIAALMICTMRRVDMRDRRQAISIARDFRLRADNSRLPA